MDYILNHVLNLIHLGTTGTFSGQISSNSQKLFSFLEIKLIEGLHCLNSCRIPKLLYKTYFLFRFKNSHDFFWMSGLNMHVLPGSYFFLYCSYSSLLLIVCKCVTGEEIVGSLPRREKKYLSDSKYVCLLFQQFHF